MKRTAKIKAAMWFCFFLMLSPLQATAYVYDYNLSGYYLTNDQVNNVSGTVSISDSFLLLEGAGTYQYLFEITGFFINVATPGGSFSFSGDANSRPEGVGNNGALVWFGPDRPFDPNVNPQSYEKQWYLYNAQGGWNNVYHTVNFYDADMQWYEPVYLNDFGKLAPHIEMGGPLFMSQLAPDQQTSLRGGDFWLERTPAPVPEPLSILLLGAGVGLLGLARKKIGAMSAR